MAESNTGSIGNIGRGADAAGTVLHLAYSGLLWAFMVGLFVFSLLFTPLMLAATLSSDRSTFYTYAWSKGAAAMSAYGSVTVAGKRQPARAVVEMIETDEELAGRVAKVKTTATLVGSLVIIPAGIAALMMAVSFALMGEFMRREEHIRGVQILDSVDDYNALQDRQQRGVEKIERGWVKRLKEFR